MNAHKNSTWLLIFIFFGIVRSVSVHAPIEIPSTRLTIPDASNGKINLSGLDFIYMNEKDLKQLTDTIMVINRQSPVTTLIINYFPSFDKKKVSQLLLLIESLEHLETVKLERMSAPKIVNSAKEIDILLTTKTNTSIYNLERISKIHEPIHHLSRRNSPNKSVCTWLNQALQSLLGCSKNLNKTD